MEYPNKIFVIEWKKEADKYVVTGLRTVIIVVAACDKNTAEEYVFLKTGINGKAVWLMNSVYPTIYTRDGSIPAPIQAKILYNAYIMRNPNSEIPEDDGFSTKEECDEYIKKNTDRWGGSLVGWTENENERFYPRFNVFD